MVSDSVLSTYQTTLRASEDRRVVKYLFVQKLGFMEQRERYMAVETSNIWNFNDPNFLPSGPEDASELVASIPLVF